MARSSKNTAASVHQRLLDKAKQTSRTFNELLQHFAIERFIYRLSKSPHANKFLLKGALMIWAWYGPGSRPTMDIDLLGKIENSLEVIVTAMKDACETAVVDDGLNFDPDTVTATRIAEASEYKGVRCLVRGNLGNARIALQVDIGFGDVVVPRPNKVVYPVLLDFPSPELNGYTMESTIAEKFQAMVKLGTLNSRMKDFYDIWFLTRTYEFSGETLAEAVEKAFKKRSTPIEVNPTVFTPSFLKGQEKQAQWLGFVRKAKLTQAPSAFAGAVTAVKIFLKPVVVALIDQMPFQGIWKAPGPWQ